MRVKIDADSRLFPSTLQDFQASISWSHESIVKEDLVFFGNGVLEKAKAWATSLPECIGKKIFVESLQRKEICFATKERAGDIRESGNLISGTLTQVLESRELYQVRAQVQAPKSIDELPEPAFDRLLGPLLETSIAVDLVDTYLGNRLLQSATQESEVGTFWIDRLLKGSLSNLNVFTKLPTDEVVGPRSAARDLTEAQRISDIIRLISSRQRDLGSTTKVAVGFYRNTHHTMHLQFRFEFGSACYSLGDRNDSFDPGSPGNFSSVTKVPKDSWKLMIRDRSWDPQYSTNGLALDLFPHLGLAPSDILSARAFRAPSRTIRGSSRR